ncbi:MAG: hypothetical protein HRT37_21720 [Alteromonadaceae bacterium]|nr:hypothetical protein [Alteromonadaceae bacterium]
MTFQLKNFKQEKVELKEQLNISREASEYKEQQLKQLSKWLAYLNLVI